MMLQVQISRSSFFAIDENRNQELSVITERPSSAHMKRKRDSQSLGWDGSARPDSFLPFEAEIDAWYS